jgi:hypothetical protein
MWFDDDVTFSQNFNNQNFNNQNLNSQNLNNQNLNNKNLNNQNLNQNNQNQNRTTQFTTKGMESPETPMIRIRTQSKMLVTTPDTDLNKSVTIVSPDDLNKSANIDTSMESPEKVVTTKTRRYAKEEMRTVTEQLFPIEFNLVYSEN